MANYNINTICVQGGYEPKNGETKGWFPSCSPQPLNTRLPSKWGIFST